MKRIIALCLTTMIFLAAGMPVSAAGCSDWDTVSISEAWCDDKGCGLLWLKKTNTYSVVYNRTCVENNGDLRYDVKSEKVKINCCQ